MAVSAKKLADYASKRDFSITAEPSGDSSAKTSGRPAFVVQKHDARRLHYDFRLEWDGVLLSWAVTKGPSADPSIKRLAVRTEDHPLDYGSFEGIIPAKQYGAGTVMLWDQGWWQPQDNFAEGLASGKLKFVLHGQRMKGKWTLVRMHTKEKRENWLLIKEHDSLEEDTEDGLTERYTTSIATARSMEDIAAGKVARKPKAKAKPGFSLATPKFRKPQLAKLSDGVPEGDDWLHETKFDGYRCLAALGKGGVKLYTRSGLDWTERYAGLDEAFVELDCRNALIDGEVVAASNSNGSHFSALQRDLEQGRPVVFMAFDLLELDGEKLDKRPLIERKEALALLLAGQSKDAPIRYSEHVVGRGPEVFKAIEKAGGEGIISKACDSVYAGSRSGSWLKIKTKLRQEFIVGGYSPSSAKGRPFASLLVGSRENGVLRYRGRVGGGLGERDLDRLSSLMGTRTRQTNPFDAVPAEVSRSAHWVNPDLVIEVDYAELTDQGSIRHGIFRGVREDKEASMVKLEKPDMPEMSTTSEHEDESFLGVRISHPDRVVFADAGYTKGDVANYYAKAAKRMLDLAGGRPVSLLRCPDGTDGDCFFQKHAGQGFPDGIGSVDIEESSGKTEPYMVIDKPGGFVAAAQMGSIEFHIWGSNADALEKPDRLVFDLDPDEGLDFAEVKTAARQLRKMLAEIGLDSVPMVTGGKGIHVIVPLRRIAEWETVAFFARTVATHLAERHPDRYVATMSKAKRKGKIFIDWLRNERGATAVAPYSIRARQGAPVAIPVTWPQLARLKTANSFEIPKALKRLEQPCPLQAMAASQSISLAVVDALETLIHCQTKTATARTG